MPRGLQASPTTQQLSLFDDLPPPPAPPRPPGLPTATPSATPAAPPPLAPAAASVPEFLHPDPQREILLAGHRVAYALRRSRRRSIGFVVGAEGLAVSAPRWVGVGEIESALREKSAWILRKLHEQRERGLRLARSRVDWRDGVEVPFLGRSVTVRLGSRGVGAMFDAEAEVPTLRLGLPPSAQPEQIRDAVQSWLQRQARRIFEERCTVFAARLGVRMKRLALSSASTRWGSASADGSIRLHWRLVHFALPVIDYVVTHELAHLREMNHSAAFWDVVREALPDYESARGALKSEVLPAFA